MSRIICVLLLLISIECFGQDLATDRPDQTESSLVVPANTVQIESGVGIELVQNESTELDERTFFAPTTLFRVAVNSKVEFRLVNTIRNHKIQENIFNNSGRWMINDLELGTKIQILDRPNGNTKIALMQHVIVPTSFENKYHFGSVTKLLMSHELSEKIGVGYNLGYVFQEKGVDFYTYSLALSMLITSKFGCYMETYGQISQKTDPVVNADAGITYLIKDNIQLDYSFGIGLSQRMNYQAIGISIRFPK